MRDPQGNKAESDGARHPVSSPDMREHTHIRTAGIENTESLLLEFLFTVLAGNSNKYWLCFI